MKQTTSITPPKAKKIPKELTIHGDIRQDDYYWLNERENPDVIDYLKAENTYTESQLSHIKAFKDDLFQEMKGRIKQRDESAPYRMEAYYYQTRYEEGKEYAIYWRKEDVPEAEYQKILDVNELAQGHEFYNETGLEVSPNNNLLAFGEDTLSRRIYTLKIKNLQTGELLEDIIPGTSGSYAWSTNNDYLFYTLRDADTLRAHKVMRHKLGTPVEEDVAIFEEKDETFSTYIYQSNSKKFLVIGSHQTISQEYRILEADNPTGEFRLFQKRERNLEHSLAHFDDQFYVLTNWEAQNFRLMLCPDNATEKENWREIIPHREDVLLEDVDVFKRHLVLTERFQGITRIRVIPKEGKEYYVPFPEEAYLAWTPGQQEFKTSTLRLGYQSMTTPPSVFNFDMENKSFDLLKQQEVLGGFSKEDYKSERHFVTVRDGAKVPVSIVYHKDTSLNGNSPLLLYGYGSYGASMEPYFSTARLSLLNRGFVYVIAHIRGGEEMGRAWYENGKLLNKKNTFYDFIDCGKYLVEKKFAAPDMLFAMGGSAGGLLMGAIINIEPSIWKGIVAAVPFVDVVTTMLDESIPLTTFEFDEWGNPKEKQFYDYIKSYSPYDNVAEKEYPAMLVTTGLHDSQVQYWEPAKWVAKLRELKKDDNLLLLHTNLVAGHGGASGRFERLKEVALEYSFLLDLAGKLGN